MSEKTSIFVDCFMSQNVGDDLFLFTLARRYPDVTFHVIGADEYAYIQREIPNIVLEHEEAFHDGGGNPLSGIRRTMNKIASRRARIASCDAMVTIAGSIYMESRKSGVKELIGRAYRSYKDVTYAKAASRYFILSANFGPFRTQGYVDSYRRFFERHCTDVCFRDRYSAGLFPGVKSVRYAPDVLFTADLPKVAKRHQAFFSVVDLGNAEKFASITGRRDAYERWVSRSIDECAAEGYEIVLASFSTPEGDDKAMTRLAASARERGVAVRTVAYTDNMDEVLRELAASEIVVGTRFHATILGLVAGARVLPIMYSDKTKHVLTDIGFDMVDAVDLKRTTDDELAAVSPVRDAVAFDVRDVIAAAQGQFAALDAFLGDCGVRRA